MKNYYFNNKKKMETFILNYKISDGKIIVMFANNHELSYPYSEENEKNIIDLMEKQVRTINAPKIKMGIKKTIAFIEWLLFFGILLDILLIYVSVCSLAIFPITFSFLLSIFNILAIEGLREGHVLKNDLEKSMLFIANKKNIDNAKQYSKNIYNGLEKSSIKENSEITISTIDNIKLKELKRFIENMNAENSLDMPLKQTDDGEKTKIKVR